MEPSGTENYDVALSNLYRQLLSDISLTQRIKTITDVVTVTLGADFSRIWITRPGDLCERGCLHGPVRNGPHVCRERSSCLHLVSSSGRYTQINGEHRRVPFGAYKIGRIASGEWSHFVTNDVVHDERVHDHEWAKRLGLVSFAGYRLVSSEGRTVGALAMFGKKVITPTQENLLETFAAIASQVTMVGVAQETLRESEEKYRTLVDNMQDAVYRCDLDGNVTFATPSAARLLGYASVEKLIGMNIAEKFYLDPHEREKLLEALNERGEVTDYEVTLKRKDNTPLVVSTNSHFYRDRDGTVAGIEGVYRDITDRKQAEERIRDLNQQLAYRVRELKTINEGLRTFSYSLSHDLRTPLVAVRGFSQRLLEKYAPHLDERGQHYLRIINTNSIQMENLISRLLAFFKVERKAVKPSHINMGAAVQEIFHQLRELYPNRTIQLNATILPDAEGDEAMIRDVLTNLLDNAIKYSEPKDLTIIEVSGWVENERIVYYVKDNGIGFPMTQKNMLFKAFQRLHPTEDIEGTGLGLAIVKRIIRRHRGNVWAESEVGEGATFYFSIPCRYD